MKKPISTRILSVMLVLAMVFGLMVPVSAADHDHSSNLSFTRTDGYSGQLDETRLTEETITTEDAHDPGEIVRASIILEEQSTIEAGFSTKEISANAAAMSYRDTLRQEQQTVTARIESAIGSKLDVQWNLTLAANIISVNIPYGQIENIKAVDGVKDVVLETRYLPQVVQQETVANPLMYAAGDMMGTSAAYACGYTGAGQRIAIIDTGLDMQHQSFDADAFAYALKLNAEAEKMTEEEYLKSLNLLDAEELTAIVPQLNAGKRIEGLSAKTVYRNMKVPFGFNYVDSVAGGHEYIDHDNPLDEQGAHGSHVAGIATANSYVPNGEGGYDRALETCYVQGNAPDAQILVMKVFGILEGAYSSDYMAAVEDAILLNCDAVNLSLGSAAPGFTRPDGYGEIMDLLTTTDTILTVAVGNNGHWASNSGQNTQGYLLADDVSANTVADPGSYTNGLSVASADNDGNVGYYFKVSDRYIFYTESVSSTTGVTYTNEPLTTLAGEQEYIFIDGYGYEEDFAALGDALEGKIAICYRGANPGESLGFYQKGQNAVKYGAIATMVCNNNEQTIGMDLTKYTLTNPLIIISMSAGTTIRAVSTPVTDEEGNVLYYTGKMNIAENPGMGTSGLEYISMSYFSAWGVPGSLEMKPEIVTPGGNIYSVDGMTSGAAYALNSGTSMAAPQLAGLTGIMAQYVRENELSQKAGISSRVLIQSLLMSTARPMERQAGEYYSILRQGAGFADVSAAIGASSYIRMEPDATESWADGKVKVELKADPDRTGEYTFSFTINNLTDREQQYLLSADLFTQGIFTDGTARYMDNRTVPMEAEVQWLVNGAPVQPAEDVAKYDFNGDGIVNTQDVQVMLDYDLGNRTELTNSQLADLDGNGVINTYDAHLLLDMLNTGLAEVSPNGSTRITVRVTLTDAQREWFGENFVNGAYVQGFFFAEELPSADGAVGTRHSIPMLGFYGNWSDASMFDTTYVDNIYTGEKKYVPMSDSNAVVVKYPGGGVAYYAGNPYTMEMPYPTGKEAINPYTTMINRMNVTMIRSAAALSTIITDQNGNQLVDPSIYYQWNSAYYYGEWKEYMFYYNTYLKLSALNVAEGDRITVSAVAIPELYETDGEITAQQMLTMMEDGTLGDGIYLSFPFTIDTQAPEILSVSKDLDNGNLTVRVRDNTYTAIVQVQSRAGTVYAQAVPQHTESGEEAVAIIDLSEVRSKIGETCILVVGDYAANETAYEINYGDDPVDYGNLFFGYAKGTTRGDGPRFLTLNPDKLYYISTTSDIHEEGMENLMPVELDVSAAEYVDGYVYMADRSGKFYVGIHDAWEQLSYLADFPEGITEIRDMAFNYADGKLYALGDGNHIFSIDLTTGAAEELVHLTVINPAKNQAAARELTMMAINDEGTFYVMCNGNPRSTFSRSSSFLFKFTKSDIVEGEIVDLAPINNDRNGGTGYYTTFGSMTWDHDEDKLFMTGSSGESGSSSSYLIGLNTETGAGFKLSDYAGGYSTDYAGRTRDTVYGLYRVPSAEVGSGYVQPGTEAISITMETAVQTAIIGGQLRLTTAVRPWNLADKSVSWSSSDEAVATVDETGLVRFLTAGEVTITATTKASPNLQASCSFTVVDIAPIDLSALITDEHGNRHWANFSTGNTANWTSTGTAGGDYVGGMVNNTLYVHDGKTMYTVNPETGETKAWGDLPVSRRWTDVAPAFTDSRAEFITITNSGVNVDFLVAQENLEGISPSTYDMYELLGGDPMVAIALKESKTYVDPYGDSFAAGDYYILTESGALWLNTFAFDNVYVDPDEHYRGGVYVIPKGDCKRLGETGLQLTGVNNLVTGQFGSMVYDEQTGMLYVAYTNEGEGTALYAIDPSTMLTSKLGDFGTATKITTLHQKTAEAGTAQTRQNMVAQAEAMETVMPNALSDSLTVNVKLDEAVTNGKLVFTYDPQKFSDPQFTDIHSTLMTAVRVEQEKGTVTIAFATAEAIPAETELFRLTLKVTDQTAPCLYTELVMDTAERNAQVLENQKETIGLETGDHNYQSVEDNDPEIITFRCTNCGHTYTTAACPHNWSEWTQTKAPTCTEAGEEVRTCTMGCGESETRTVPAKGHSYQVETVAPTCTEAGYDRYTCSACGDSHKKNEVPAKGHGYEAVETKPTCTEMGYTTYTCAVCGHSYKDNYVNPTGHDYQKTVTAPTCTDYGYTTYTCACGSSYVSDYVAALGHSFGEWEVVKPGTCTENGQEKRTCSVCGETETRDIIGGGHSYQKTVTDPTCTDYGYTTYTCACGHSYVSDYVAAKGHSYGAWTVTTPATCTEKGTETRTCSVCGEKETRPVEATGHSFGQWTVVKAATCTEDGKETRICACGESETRAIPATGHSFSAWQVTREATCTEDGVETRTCACGETEERTIRATGHNWSNWSVTKAATCTEKGEETRTCGNCNKTERRAIDALGHNCTTVTVSATCTTDGYSEYTCTVCGYTYRDNVVKAMGHNYEAAVSVPTCTEKGYTTYTCKNCGDTYISDYVDALGHVFGEWKVTKSATCTEEGTETRSCACGESESRAIPATGHSFGQWEVVEPATCTEDGIEARSCACGKAEERTIAATGHELTVAIVEPTCTEMGYTQYLCSVCGYAYREAMVDATGHNYKAVITAPTCTEAGYTTYTCTVCGDAYVADETAALGHDWGDWTVTTEATCFTDGEETRTCATCGETETQVVEKNSDNCPSKVFSDLNTNQWYHEAVDYVLNNGLMNGVAADKFAPGGTLTRAQLVTILYRLEGEPSVEGMANPFTDVAEGQWYTDAIIWAADAGVVNGMTATIFNPNGAITREQMAAILYRYAGAPEVGENLLGDYPDGNKVSAYAVDAISWAIAEGILTGSLENGKTMLLPGNSSTRAQVAAVICRYLSK